MVSKVLVKDLWLQGKLDGNMFDDKRSVLFILPARILKKPLCTLVPNSAFADLTRLANGWDNCNPLCSLGSALCEPWSSESF